MNSEELLTELSQRDVILSAVDDKLRIDAPKGLLTSELRQALTEQKRALLALLQSKPIAAAPTIQEVDSREKELDELIRQLREVNRHHKIEWARGRKVPLKALLHAATYWLSEDPSDWTAANDTIFAFTSHWGHKQLCYRLG